MTRPVMPRTRVAGTVIDVSAFVPNTCAPAGKDVAGRTQVEYVIDKVRAAWSKCAASRGNVPKEGIDSFVVAIDQARAASKSEMDKGKTEREAFESAITFFFGESVGKWFGDKARAIASAFPHDDRYDSHWIDQASAALKALSVEGWPILGIPSAAYIRSGLSPKALATGIENALNYYRGMPAARQVALKSWWRGVVTHSDKPAIRRLLSFGEDAFVTGACDVAFEDTSGDLAPFRTRVSDLEFAVVAAGEAAAAFTGQDPDLVTRAVLAESLCEGLLPPDPWGGHNELLRARTRSIELAMEKVGGGAGAGSSDSGASVLPLAAAAVGGFFLFRTLVLR